MIIDLTQLVIKSLDELFIEKENFSFPKEYFDKSEILDLNDTKVSGYITLDEDDYPNLDLDLSGVMVLVDSISLEEITYPFSIKIAEKMEEKLENVTNTIDIIDVLWQNIVLEVPLQLTEVKDFSQYQGEGWRLVSEEDLNKKNNPFSNLKDLLGEEW